MIDLLMNLLGLEADELEITLDPREYMADLRTGFVYKVDHLRSGELTPEELIKYAKEVREARIEELRSWWKHEAFRVIPRDDHRTRFRRPMSSRWP